MTAKSKLLYKMPHIYIYNGSRLSYNKTLVGYIVKCVHVWLVLQMRVVLLAVAVLLEYLTDWSIIYYTQFA